MDEPGYSIGDVSERTGIAVPVLRMWESRFGFPDPERRPNGRRRYTDADVRSLRQLLRHREAGMSLGAAIEKAREAWEDVPATVFAGLRRRRTDLIPSILSKRTMMDVSHAIEDEFCARSQPAALFGSFQRERFYRNSERRWRDLARTAEVAIVFADFERKRKPRRAPIEIPIDRADPVSREWALVCDGEGYAACLAGWELPGQKDVPDMERRFEALWSIEADVVREAVGVALELVSRSAPEVVEQVPARLRHQPPPSSEDLRTLVSLTNRILSYSTRGG
jgi:MerR family transcriptional regulator, light-induced transcriptional regulator